MGRRSQKTKPHRSTPLTASEAPNPSRSWLFVLGAVLALIGVLAATRISDPDTMQYLASGRYIASHGLEDGCIYSYAAEHCQIVYPQWLFHLFAFGLYRAGGWTALGLAQIVVVLAIFSVVAVLHRRWLIHPVISTAAL